MSGVLDAQLHIGKESTYGTGVTPTRSFEPYTDDHRKLLEFLESSGMRAGMQTMRSDRRRPVNKGDEGSLEFDVLDKGFGMLFEAMFPTNAIAQVGATAAWTQTHDTAVDASDVSLTVQFGRPPIAGATQPFTYKGGKVKSFEFSQDLDDLLKLTLDMDYQDSETVTALATSAYPASARPFGWDDAACNVNASPVSLTSFSVAYDSMLDTERYFLDGTLAGLKKEPCRAGHPQITGELAIEFEDLTEYNRFVAGTIIPIDITWTGVNIEGANDAYVKITLAACQYDGNATPVVSQADLPRQPLPFKVLDDGTNPAIQVEYQSTDTAF